MKKLTFTRLLNWLVMATVFFFFASCVNNLDKEESELTDVRDSKIEMIYQQILEAPDFETRKMLHAALSNTEKIAFWQHRIDVLISQRNYKGAQLAFMLDSRDFVADILDDDPNDDELGELEPCLATDSHFENTPEEIFSMQEIARMFTLAQMGVDRNYSEGENQSIERSMPICDCYSTGWDCTGNDKCSWKISCTTTSGCGIFGLCTCRGRCW